MRREEVARLASISTDYYTRIEQGRIKVSAPVLGTLAETSDADQQLMVWTAPTDSPTHQALRFLASWSESSAARR